MRGVYLTIFLSFTMLNGALLAVKAKNNIKYKSKIIQDDISLVYIDKEPNGCKLASIDDILDGKHRAKIFIKKDRILCEKDLFIPETNKLIFNFGPIQIERDGKILKETDEYITIKNADGSIEKIYKNGEQ